MASSVPLLTDVHIKDMQTQYSATGKYQTPDGAFHSFALTLETSDGFLLQKGRVTLYLVGDEYKRPVEPPVSEELMKAATQAVVDKKMDEFEKTLDSYISLVLQSDRENKNRRGARGNGLRL